jgi:Xaa-Pro aminopeptidase
MLQIDHHIETLSLTNAELHRELRNCKKPHEIKEVHEALNALTISIQKLKSAARGN